MANKDLTIRLKVQNLISAGLSDAQKHLGAFAKGVGGNLMNVKAGFDMIKNSVMAFYEVAKKPLEEAFKFESATISFKVLMGSMDEAKKRMEELAEFAAKTPFELGELVKASKMLHTFSEGALGGIESMRLIGDAAAAVGQPFEEVAFWVGRAYSMLKSGEPFGRAALRLQEMAILAPDVRLEMEDLQKSGASNIQVWNRFTDSIKKFEGGMIQLSKTGDGLTSTLKDDWTAAVRAFGNEFSNQAKGGISEMSTMLQKMVDDGSIKEIGKQGNEGLKDFMESAKPVIPFLTDFIIKTNKIRSALGIDWKSVLAGPMGAIMQIGPGIKNQIIEGFKFAIGRKTPQSENADNETEAVEDKNKKIVASDKRTNEQRIADDMKRSQAFLDNVKKEEQRKKDQEELDKYLTKQTQDRLSDEVQALERLRDEKTKATLLEIELEEERANKLKEISEDLANSRHEDGMRELEDQLAIDRKKFESFRQVADMSVKEYLKKAQEQENADKEKNKELGKFNRLYQLSSTGAKLSAKDQKFFDAFREKERAKMEAGKLLPNIMGAAQRIDEQRKRDAEMATIRLEKKFDELMKQR